MKTEGIIYPELSYEIMGAIYEVHNALGPGFLEGIYQEALMRELEMRHIPFEREKTVTVTYKGHVVGIHRLDIIVDNKIILELKAVSALNDTFKQQLKSYLKATRLQLGILVNFGSTRVEYTRIVNQKANQAKDAPWLHSPHSPIRFIRDFSVL
ncbi:MAG: GxxExxY protein [Chloroflexota bacterium]